MNSEMSIIKFSSDEMARGVTQDIVSVKEHSGFKVVNYNKNNLRSHDETYGGVYSKYRSVVFNEKNDMVMCSQFKSLAIRKFENTYDLDNIDLVLEEFVEGTMINVFHDDEHGWQIATRSRVGGSNSFYNQEVPDGKTFRVMFEEAMGDVGLTYDILDKGISYSFVLQHVENRVVSTYQYNDLILVDAYRITNNSDGALVEMIDVFTLDSELKNTKVRMPQRYLRENYNDYADVKKAFDVYVDDKIIQGSALLQNVDNVIKGVMVKNIVNGHRMKIRNTTYEFIAKLRGNQAKLEFHYLTLRKEKKITLFLQLFPEFEERFQEFRDKVHNFTQAIYHNYFKCFKERSIPLKDAPYELRGHLYTLHGHYISTLRPAKKTMQFANVLEFVNNLPEARLMFSMNFNMRPKKGETYTNEDGNESMDL